MSLKMNYVQCKCTSYYGKYIMILVNKLSISIYGSLTFRKFVAVMFYKL